MSVPPYAAAFVVSIATSYVSDKIQMRGPFVVLFNLVAMIGYVIYLTSRNNSVLYGSLFLTIPGIYVNAGLTGAWQCKY